MGTLRDYFTTDQEHGVKVTQTQELTGLGGYKIPCQMFLDFGSGAITLAFYLAAVTDPLQRCIDLITGNAIDAVLSATGGFSVQTSYPADAAAADATTLRFCGRVYVYSENRLAEVDVATILRIARQRRLIVQYRGPEWASQRTALEKPLAFISHDSRDKEEIARPLASELTKFPGCTVWYDEYSLKIGDNLRESIESGIKSCRKCVLLLSKHFLANKGWTKEEFDAIFTRQLIEQANLVLPVWCGVTKQEIFAYSPSLANRWAASWNDGVESVARQIYKAAIA
jgi:TIR domain